MGMGVVLVGVVCRHPLDARADALHCLDICLRSFPAPVPVRVLFFALCFPPACRLRRLLAWRPVSPSPLLPASPFTAPGPLPRCNPSCLLPCACPLPPPAAARAFALPLPLPLPLPSPVTARPSPSRALRLPPCPPLPRASAGPLARLTFSGSGLDHPSLQLRHHNGGRRRALGGRAAGGHPVPWPRFAERSSGCRGFLQRVGLWAAQVGSACLCMGAVLGTLSALLPGCSGSWRPARGSLLGPRGPGPAWW